MMSTQGHNEARVKTIQELKNEDRYKKKNNIRTLVNFLANTYKRRNRKIKSIKLLQQVLIKSCTSTMNELISTYGRSLICFTSLFSALNVFAEKLV